MQTLNINPRNFERDRVSYMNLNATKRPFGHFTLEWENSAKA